MTKSEAIKNLSTLIFKINEQHYALNNDIDIVHGKPFDKEGAKERLKELEDLYVESLSAALFSNTNKYSEEIDSIKD